ncbi:hypothetical protein G3N62_33095, partial [Burkholderia sp. Tr-20355]|nr:hypothetical protein [Burkholderia sp. Tr-20355]
MAHRTLRNRHFNVVPGGAPGGSRSSAPLALGRRAFHPALPRFTFVSMTTAGVTSITRSTGILSSRISQTNPDARPKPLAAASRAMRIGWEWIS